MIDPRPFNKDQGPPAPPRARFLASARAMFEPGAAGLLHNDPIDEGARIIALAVYGPRCALAAATDEGIDQIATATWFSARRAGFDRAGSVALVEHLAGSLRRQIRV